MHNIRLHEQPWTMADGGHRLPYDALLLPGGVMNPDKLRVISPDFALRGRYQLGLGPSLDQGLPASLQL